MTTLKTIKPGQTLTAQSICDSNCIFTAEVVARSKSMVTVKVMDGIKRCKIKTDREGNEYIMALGTYSMAPSFSLR